MLTFSGAASREDRLRTAKKYLLLPRTSLCCQEPVCVAKNQFALPRTSLRCREPVCVAKNQFVLPRTSLRCQEPVCDLVLERTVRYAEYATYFMGLMLAAFFQLPESAKSQYPTGSVFQYVPRPINTCYAFAFFFLQRNEFQL
jgi:hypothetical protein